MGQVVAQYFLRTPDGSVYGPADMATLCTWATDARVIPGCALSVDKAEWRAVEEFPELRLEWSVQFEDGTFYGPLNLLAIWVLAREQSIPKGVALIHRQTHRRVVLNDLMQPLLVEECRAVLAGCGRIMGETLGALFGERRELATELSASEAQADELKARLEQADLDVQEARKALAALQTNARTSEEASLAAARAELETARAMLSDRESQLGALKFKLAQAESDLAINLKLVSETQRHLSESEGSGGRNEALAREIEILRANLVTARMTLTERESQLEALRLKQGDTENELAVSQKLASETQRRLAEYAALAALAGAGNQENEALCKSLATARVDLAEKESQLEVARAKASQLEADLREERVNQARGAGEVQEELSRVRSGLAQATERVAALEPLEGIRRLLDEQVAGLRQKVQESGTALADSQQAALLLRSEFQTLQARCTVMEGDLDAARRALGAAEERLRAEQEAQGRLRSDHEALTAQLQKATAEAREKDDLVRSRDDKLAQALEKARLDEATLAQLRRDGEGLAAEHQKARAGLQEKENEVCRLESRLAVAQAEAERQVAQLESKLEYGQQALQAEQTRVRTESETASQLRRELDSFSSRIHALQGEVQDREQVARKLESSLAVQRADHDRQVATLRSKIAVLEKDLQLARQNAHTLSLQLAQAKEASVKSQKASRQSEQKLKDEIASVQSDLNGLLLASKCVKQATGKSGRAAIDWMSGESAPAAAAGGDADVQAKFEKLPLAEKILLLQKELQSSAEQKELLRRELDAVKGRYELVGGEAAKRERELEDKLAQARKELRTSAEQLAQAMQEVEKREVLVRDLRKKAAGAAGSEPKATVLEAEVIHAESLGPVEPAPHEGRSPEAEASPDPTAPEPPPGGAPKGHILNSVEAQLQRELKHWEHLKRKDESKEGTFGKWFRRKT